MREKDGLLVVGQHTTLASSSYISSKEPQRGGRAYGQGMNGRTIDAVGDPSDPDTLAALLSQQRQVWTVYPINARGRRLAPISSSDPAFRSSVEAALRSPSLLVKVFEPKIRSVSDVFETELDALSKVISAFGTVEEAGRRTTIVAPEVLLPPAAAAGGGDKKSNRRGPRGPPPKRRRLMLGLSVSDGGGVVRYFGFTSKCDTSLDKYSFATASDVDAFVRDILETLQSLHASGILHGDIKLDNMVHCSGRGFRLIDWGGSENFKIALSDTARISGWKSSPLFMYVAMKGRFHFMSRAIHIILNSKTSVTRSAFRAHAYTLVVEAYDSFLAAVKRLGRKHGDRFDDIMKEIRSSFIPSIDLYNFGLTLLHVANEPGAAPLRDACIQLARRLVLYNHKEFLGKDAHSALAWWNEATTARG